MNRLLHCYIVELFIADRINLNFLTKKCLIVLLLNCYQSQFLISSNKMFESFVNLYKPNFKL